MRTFCNALWDSSTKLVFETDHVWGKSKFPLAYENVLHVSITLFHEISIIATLWYQHS